MVQEILTADLMLKVPDGALAKEVVAYYLRNRSFVKAFEPERSAEYFTISHQQDILQQERVQIEKKEALYFYITEKQAPEKIIGKISLTNIVWGCFCSCFLGYKLDAQRTNQGYMTQAILAVTKFAFEVYGLHRIEANVMPHNTASLRVLEKCGFESEGLSRKYLKINGVWEDHVHMVLLNEGSGKEGNGV